jgi:hypothetical protein
MTPRGATPVASITINAPDPAEQRLWQTVAAIARQFGDDDRWCLVGGLMVALFAMQAALRPRVTTDINVLANAKARLRGWQAAVPPSEWALCGHACPLPARFACAAAGAAVVARHGW